MKKVLKISAYVFAALFFIFWFFVAYGYFRPKLGQYLRERNEARIIEEAAKQQAEYESALKNDTLGGTTPEATLDLFLSELRAGNAGTAAEYYELSVRDKALASLKKELAENGDFKKTIDYFTEVKEKGKKECNKNGDGCTFRYKFIYDSETKVPVLGTKDFLTIPKGGSLNEIVDVSLNKYTHVWKITQPY